MDQAMDWLDAYVKGSGSPPAASVEVQNGEGWWRSEAAWPPEDARPWVVELNDGSYRDIDDGSFLSFDVPTVQRWNLLTFTPPAPHDVHIAGAPVVRATVDPGLPRVNMVAGLYDLGPAGREGKLITVGVMLLRGRGEIEFELYPQDWVLRRGHRLGVVVHATDPLFMPSSTGSEVSVRSASVSLPALRWRREATLEGGPAEAMRLVPTKPFDPARIQRFTRSTSFPPPLQD